MAPRYQHVGIPNAKFWCREYCPTPTPRLQGFCVAVEYRLKSIFHQNTNPCGWVGLHYFAHPPQFKDFTLTISSSLYSKPHRLNASPKVGVTLPALYHKCEEVIMQTHHIDIKHFHCFLHTKNGGWGPDNITIACVVIEGILPKLNRAW